MYSNPIIFIIMQRDIYYNFYFMPLSENSYYFIYAPHLRFYLHMRACVGGLKGHIETKPSTSRSCFIS
jgi:hypothetical protein